MKNADKLTLATYVLLLEAERRENGRLRKLTDSLTVEAKNTRESFDELHKEHRFVEARLVELREANEDNQRLEKRLADALNYAEGLEMALGVAHAITEGRQGHAAVRKEIELAASWIRSLLPALRGDGRVGIFDAPASDSS